MTDDKLRNVLLYSSNNSGGDWWLSDENWKALEDAGWVVHWFHSADTEHEGITHEETAGFGEHSHAYGPYLLRSVSDGTRWMGALATSAAKETDDPAVAVAEWEEITGENASDQGCNCCGPPHSFRYYDSEGNERYTFVEVVQTSLRWS